MRDHSIQVYGEWDTTSRRSGDLTGALESAACQP